MTRRALAFLLAGAALSGHAIADESSQPYMDSLKKASPQEFAPDTSAEGYTQKQKNALPAPRTGSSEESYSESLKRQLPEDHGAQSYTDRQKALLGPSEPGGAIQAVKEGHSELKTVKRGDIHGASGIRVGASGTRTVSPVSADAANDNFDTLYGNGYGIDLQFFYEYQFFHDELAGSLGLLASFGVGYSSGHGQFALDLPKPGGGTFGSQSQTKFQFFTMPLTVAGIYRFNLMHYLRPFILGGPAVVGYIESRNDSKSGYHGDSRGLYGSVGVNILLDGLSSTASWDMYSSYGIHHTYLTLEYSDLSTFSGDVDFSVRGLGAGLTFEF